MVKLYDELMCMCPPSRQFDLVIGCVRSAVADVLEKTPMEQVRVLRDERYGSPNAPLGYFTNVSVIDADGPFDHIVHAQQQAHQGGFAGAARSHEADSLPCRDGELKGFDDVASMPGPVFGGSIVRKGNVLETNGTLRHYQFRRTRPVHDRSGHNQRSDALAR